MSDLHGNLEAQIAEIIGDFEAHGHMLKTFRLGLMTMLEDASLSSLIHSTKSRIKDPEHLRDKLRRKFVSDQDPDNLTCGCHNYLEKINDLVGIRILHLHTHQVQHIIPELTRCLEDHSYVITEGPEARTWDLENKAFFEGLGIQCVDSISLYTSIHFVVRANLKKPYTAEIQLRTLSEEIWGETNHSINYPHATTSLACREQIKALARVTSSATRLVDSIFATHADSQKQG